MSVYTYTKAQIQGWIITFIPMFRLHINSQIYIQLDYVIQNYEKSLNAGFGQVPIDHGSHIAVTYK